ncbi:MAG TPA: heavy metal translocating P-type ATPase [Gemmatimonadaceae bacterium]|nr:heavy metal translocating P-type ATPase [Gemmatimonadaceae bacterium]
MHTDKLPPRRAWQSWLRAGWLPFVTIAFVALGTLVVIGDASPAAAEVVWWLGLLIVGTPLVLQTAREVASGRFAVDLVATLAILLALILWQPLAGLVIVLMQSGGEALERYAERKATDAVRALEDAAPRLAHRISGRSVDDIEAGDVRVGDLLLIRPGELIPCDGIVITGRSHIDVAKLTGEPLPVTVVHGSRVMSGSLNQESPLEIEALAPASESQYARIVELVRSAQASKAPLQRLADRYGVWFTPLTLVVCLVAYAISGDPVRILAILVVATPCPLLLAVPVAMIGGINSAARRQIIIRNGTALENLGQLTTAVFDKTGTVTVGRPQVRRVIRIGSLPDSTILRLSGAVERGSSHLLARTLVEAAEQAYGPLPLATDVHEDAGRGVNGLVEGHAVTVGAASYALDRYPVVRAALDSLNDQGEGLRAYVVVDGRLSGIIEYADRVRPGIPDLLSALRRLGVKRALLLSGDQYSNVRSVADEIGIREAAGDLLPEQKVNVVRDLVKAGERVAMIGDGTNDAPALSTATVGIALASQGGGITAEAADVVILVDDISRVAESVRISQRTMRIARQSIWFGLGLSAGAAAIAALGGITPVQGALLQEVIDVAVILNALRASKPLESAEAISTRPVRPMRPVGESRLSPAA